VISQVDAVEAFDDVFNLVCNDLGRLVSKREADIRSADLTHRSRKDRVGPQAGGTDGYGVNRCRQPAGNRESIALPPEGRRSPPHVIDLRLKAPGLEI